MLLDIEAMCWSGLRCIIDYKHYHVMAPKCSFGTIINYSTIYDANIMQDYKELFNENGMPKGCYPNHWKGENGIYCAF